MKNNDSINDILNQTFFGLYTLEMINDVEIFIEFAEKNIKLQKSRDHNHTERMCEQEEFDDPDTKNQYITQMLDVVDYRYDFVLTQRIRYASLTAVITTAEWCLLSLKKRATFDFLEKPKGTNELVHALSVFNEKTLLGLDYKIDHLKIIIQVRNCVVHHAGLLSAYKYDQQLRESLLGFSGIKVSDINYLGECIEIEQGFLEGLIRDFREWLPNIERVALDKELVRIN